MNNIEYTLCKKWNVCFFLSPNFGNFPHVAAIQYGGSRWHPFMNYSKWPLFFPCFATWSESIGDAANVKQSFPRPASFLNLISLFISLRPTSLTMQWFFHQGSVHKSLMMLCIYIINLCDLIVNSSFDRPLQWQTLSRACHDEYGISHVTAKHLEKTI